MKQFIFKRVARLFFLSFIWLLIPLDLIVIPIMQDLSAEAEKELTPYSINVNGYQRSDGSYVGSYSRRPPGSVEHDKPFESKINLIFWCIVFLVIINIFSLGFLVILALEEILNRSKNYKRFIEFEIISIINFDISILKNKPKNLINRLISNYKIYKIYKCRLCHRNIKYEEFHHSSLAIKNPTKTCIDCMKIDNQNYHNELQYAIKFDELLKLYTELFNDINKTLYPDCIIESKEINKFFCDSVIKERRLLSSNKYF